MLILIPLIVVSWGMKGKEKTAFRPAMALSSGEMSAIGGSMLLMTATATSRTVRLLMDELPEVKKWNLILNSPLREGVTIVIPPTELLSTKFEVSLEPFIVRMRQGEIYLILVRGKHNLTQMLLVCLLFRYQQGLFSFSDASEEVRNVFSWTQEGGLLSSQHN